MMETKPLPTCNEYDPLDAHLEELEEPGTNYLQDFIVLPQKHSKCSPLNGYTSEESDYSVVTPSEEHYMSFVQTAYTGEPVGVVDDLSSSDLTTVSSQQHQQTNAGKVIKAKTSKYRGVTQTSKTSWGAKYSAKRITNTCKTPEEAAYAYDEYLKKNYPLKYAKFANFCGKCGKFVNPLGLPQFQCECKCLASHAENLSPDNLTISPKKDNLFTPQISTPTTSTPSLIPPTAPSPAAGPCSASMHGSSNMLGSSIRSLDLSSNFISEENAFISSHRSSSMSIGSLQFSFSEDTEHFFAESFDDVAKMATDLDTSASVGLQQQRDLKRDNLPIAIITSAVDSFTQEGNLDDIIKDIKRTSSSHSLIKRNTEEMRTGRGSFGSYVVTGSSSSNIAMGNTNSTAQIQVEPSGTNSLDFDMNELDELTNYFLWDNDVAMFDHRETQTKSTIMNQRVAMAGQNSQLTKMHSLDFDAEVSICESSTRSKIVVGEVKFEDTVPISSFVANPVTAMSFSCPHYPTVIDIQTKFLDKYWRNDRKNIQCFPRCPEHGDYYRVRIENLQHRCKGVCRAPVRAHVCIPAPVSASVTQHGLLVLARCNSTFSRNSNSTEQQLLSLPEIKALRAVSAVGTVDNFTLDTEGVNFDVIFHPDVWKFEFDLPKKRRYVQNSNSNVPLYGADRDIDGDLASAEFLYFFEIDVFYSSDQTHFERLGHMKSKSFQIGNTRTLLRRRNKLVGENHIIGGSYATDSDQLADVDELPEKKRIKVAKSRHEIVSGKSFSEDGFGSSGLTGSRVSTANNAGEDIFSSPKRDFPDEKSTILNVDRLSKFDFQDVVNWKKDLSEFSQVKVNFWEDGNIEDAVASNYFPFISPKQNSGNVLAIYSPVFAALPMKAQSNDQPVTSGSRVMEKAPSLAKFMVYSLVCVPLSMLLLPVGLILLIGFLIFPPAASKIVSTLDAMSDLELSRANISCTSEDHRMVLNRLIEHKDEHAGNLMTVMFRYHTKGKVWGRIFYFSGAKFVFSIISIIPAFFLTSMAGLLYPIRPVSSALAKSACGFALWSREYTRETMGKPLARVDEVDAVV